jgi:hypothetical protein
MKAELDINALCPNCNLGFVLTKQEPGLLPRIMECPCGFKCLVPTIEVTPCDRDGNELPAGITTEYELMARNCERKV